MREYSSDIVCGLWPIQKLLRSSWHRFPLSQVLRILDWAANQTKALSTICPLFALDGTIQSSTPGKIDAMKKLTLALGIAVIATAFLLVVVLLLDSMRWSNYVEVLAPPRDVSQQERILREKLNYYEKSADELKTLVSLLLGLSTLYGLALGVGSYLNVQEAKNRADETIGRLITLENKTGQDVERYENRLEKQQTEYEKRFDVELKRFDADTQRYLNDIRREFPLFRNMQGAIRKIANKLQEFIPDTEYGRDIYQKIDVNDRVMIEHYERSIAAFEFFTLQPFSEDASRIFTMLGSYYSRKYTRENSEYLKVANTGGTKPDRADISRARMYLSRAREIAPKSISPLNELGYLEVVVTGDSEKAAPFLEISLALYPDQQRARYYLAIVEHIRGSEARTRGNKAEAIKHYQISVDQLTTALTLNQWQAVEEPGRYRRAIHYNRACARARLGELADDELTRTKLFREAIEDLNKTFPVGQTPDEQRKTDLGADLVSPGDFFELANKPDLKDELEAIRKRTGV
jgi:tetratricopeptide (TPR) repeat protein